MNPWTPGPWAVHRWVSEWDRKRVYVTVSGGEEDMPIARIQSRYNKESDARLIAAAPDMYAALEDGLKELEQFLSDEVCDHTVGICFCGARYVVETMAAALAKARGEA